MKKWTALFLAFVLALSLPLIFAANEFDSPEHDHDHDCDHEILRVNDPWCDVCGNYTFLVTEAHEPWVADYDEYSHIWTFSYTDSCENCGAFYAYYSTDSLEGHDMRPGATGLFDYCTICGHRDYYD